MSSSENPPRFRSDLVDARLRRAILTGEYAPGDPLPSERALGELHRVDRSAVRQALARLRADGLVEAGTSGPRVSDWRTTGGLDLLSDLAAFGEVAPLFGEIAEMRACLGADAARLCALRAPAALRAELPELARAIPSAEAHRRFEDRYAAYQRLWSRIVEGSGNVVYRLALNTLSAARLIDGGIDPSAYAAEVNDPEAARAIADAIARGDAEQARRLAFELLQRTVDAG